jgi:hypothetical protein
MRPAQSVKINAKLATALYHHMDLEGSPFNSFGEVVRYACIRFLKEAKE